MIRFDTAFDFLLPRVVPFRCRYYDCFIERSTAARRAEGLGPPLTVALALNEQLVDDDRIPVGPFDQQVDYVVTPCGIFTHFGR